MTITIIKWIIVGCAIVAFLILWGLLCTIIDYLKAINNRLDRLNGISVSTDVTKENTRTTYVQLNKINDALIEMTKISIAKRFEELSNEEKLKFFTEALYKGGDE